MQLYVEDAMGTADFVMSEVSPFGLVTVIVLVESIAFGTSILQGSRLRFSQPNEHNIALPRN